MLLYFSNISHQVICTNSFFLAILAIIWMLRLILFLMLSKIYLIFPAIVELQHLQARSHITIQEEIYFQWIIFTILISFSATSIHSYSVISSFHHHSTVAGGSVLVALSEEWPYLKQTIKIHMWYVLANWQSGSTFTTKTIQYL